MPFAGEHVPASGNWCTCDMYSAVRRGLAFSSGLHISSDAICSISISFNCPTAHNGCVGLYIDCHFGQVGAFSAGRCKVHLRRCYDFVFGRLLQASGGCLGPTSREDLYRTQKPLAKEHFKRGTASMQYPASIAALHTWSGAAWGVPPDSLATQSAAGDCISPSNSV
eukprot:TRINITY_DN14789_c0_g1_i2.p1 TRINITY_DN14789_c0_g1~~TRINITY_DN14789_c0_g1_i2.p1  ORF type:complete len:167 (+),score=10.27 TRINITY_DN14789_c0_g1_i2:101-601(+)